MQKALTPQEMPQRERPISEQFRTAALRWADCNNAANLKERSRSAVLARRKAHLIEKSGGKMSAAKAEMLVKAGQYWQEYNDDLCAKRYEADKAKVEMEFLRMRHSEWIGADANNRHEYRLTKG